MKQKYLQSIAIVIICIVLLFIINLTPHGAIRFWTAIHLGPVAAIKIKISRQGDFYEQSNHSLGWYYSVKGYPNLKGLYLNKDSLGFWRVRGGKQ